MAHASILGRMLDWPIVNLGFSGNAKSEPEVAQLLAGLDPAVYVLDSLPNLSVEEAAERLEPPDPKATKPARGRKAAAKAPAAPKEPRVSRFAKLYPDNAKVTVLVEGNPKRGASKARFDGYTGSATVGEARAKGVTLADLAWDVGHGLIKVDLA